VTNRSSPIDGISSTKIVGPMIMICGHHERDARCGLVGPLLLNEFKTVLSEKNLLYSESNPSGVRLTICSHVGGHAFAGNVVIHPGPNSTIQSSIWYGKVFPHHVQGIVNETIENDRIIEQLLRGRGVKKAEPESVIDPPSNLSATSMLQPRPRLG
jgi:hypothetical protein